MSFGYSVLGFGSSATIVSGTAAPTNAIIKSEDDDDDNVTVYMNEGGWNPIGIAPDEIGALGSGDPIEISVASAPHDLPIRILATSGVTGSVDTHAWTAVITHLSGSGGTWVGGSATATASTANFTTPSIDQSTVSVAARDVGVITFSYTATNAGGSDAADDVVVFWTATS